MSIDENISAARDRPGDCSGTHSLRITTIDLAFVLCMYTYIIYIFTYIITEMCTYMALDITPVMA